MLQDRRQTDGTTITAGARRDRIWGYCPEDERLQDVSQPGFLGVLVPSDPGIACCDAEDRVAQAEEADQLAVMSVLDQKTHPSAITR